MLFGKRLLLESPSPLSLLESCKSIKQALQIHAQIVLNGLQWDLFSVSRLISFFSLSDSKDGLDHARLLFMPIDRPNLFIWNTMIRGYARSDSPQEAFALFVSMTTKGIESPNNYTFPFLLNSCARLPSAEQGREIHCCIIKNGFESDAYTRNSLIHFYSVWGYMEDAWNIFDASSLRDLVSYNTMIKGYVQVGQPEFALCLFKEMQHLNIKPDEFTFVALFSTCSMLNDSKIGKEVHALVYKTLSPIDSNVLMKNAIIDMYAKCGSMNMAEKVFGTMRGSRSPAAWSSMISGYARTGEIDISRELFDQMQEHDVVSWTAMINSYSQAGRSSEALELFVEMESQGIKPDEVTVVAVVSACAQLGALGFGKQMHHRYVENGLFGQNSILTSSIIDMYAKCGSIDTALNIFHQTPKNLRTIVLFNSIISGLAQHGLGESAVTVFKEMEYMGLKPNEITFTGLLCACSHGGLVEEGKKWFEYMFNDYGIKPKVEHYGCMVDILGRGGHLEEAYDLIQKMPFKPNSVIWRALLGACRIHGNVEVAKIAGQKLLETEPDHGAQYVLLSNMFADANQWEEAVRMRKVMEDRSIEKPAGWSYIEINGTLHRFFASHKSHPQANEIELMVKDMAVRLKSAGYVPSTAQVVFDIDEEEKQTVVSHHSERLALAFGLINCSSNDTIRIVKNLRICADCHLVFKLLSKIYSREIIVRDAIRFHHFSNGFCSCKDFW
ncbi:pentatricopeptide repeat-containing protein At2g29760, chloroplastic-like [Malania oleifera]|uniref:pentatricopeptide repeat-containing protein At2g29760, chloroplastic-like n=1 Tax=Malania oleifera TaxID=397392 RepID=UPI0025ADFE26|nr:pentatricopeptide repeat-containing protein At2g29760, chloroplastic-like [Malania oleifera]